MKARLQSYRSYRRVFMLAVLTSVGVLLAPGCESRGEDPKARVGTVEGNAKEAQPEPGSVQALEKKEENENQAPEVIYEKGAAPTPETPLARGKDIEITFADYELAMHRSLLYAPLKSDGSPYLEVPVERTASSELQNVLISHLLETRAVREETEKRGITCSDNDVKTMLASRKPLEKYALLFTTDGDLEKQSARVADLAALKMTKEDVRIIACEEVLSKKLQDALLADIDDAELWTAYQHARNTVDLMLVSVSNTPSSAELNTFIEQDQARKEPRIDVYFAKHTERYMLPRMARLTILSAPAGQDGPEVADKLQRATNRLSSGEDPKAIASGLGLVLESDSETHAGESPRAFAAEVGGTGFELEGPRGAYAWRLEGFRDVEQLELTRPLRREIAAELLRESGILDSTKQKLLPAIATMKSVGALKKEGLSEEQIEALRAELAESDLKVVRTNAFARTPQGFIPGIGLAQEVVEAAFELSEKSPTFDEPVLSRDRVFAFRLVAREHPSKSEFKREKVNFRKSYVEARRDHIVSSFTAAKYADANIVVDLLPVRIKYGTLAKAKK